MSNLSQRTIAGGGSGESQAPTEHKRLEDLSSNVLDAKNRPESSKKTPDDKPQESQDGINDINETPKQRIPLNTSFKIGQVSVKMNDPGKTEENDDLDPDHLTPSPKPTVKKICVEKQTLRAFHRIASGLRTPIPMKMLMKVAME